MAQRILVVDTDTDFTGALKAGFESLGVNVEVVEDGDLGVERATAERPDLILLAIELRGVNGFLICKKLKKSNELKDIPLVILSSEASDEIFEQHKKLRTRAEDYLHKPIPFDTLLESVQRLMPIGDLEESVEDDRLSVSDIEIDDSVAIDDLDEPPTEQENEGRTRGAVDDDIDAFAESAFGNLVMDDEATSVGALPEHLQRELAARQAAPVAAHVQPPTPTPTPTPAPTPASVPPPPAPSREIERLEREVADLKARVAKGTSGGVSSREFLDLREGLNRKDKEILELRDQVSLRDRQLLDSNDKGLVFERKIADFEDRAVSIERELEDTKAKVQTLSADKDQLQKRADDLKTRLERAELKVKKTEDDLDVERAAHSKAVDDARAEASVALEHASESAQQALAAAKTAAASELEAARATSAAELAAASDRAQNALDAANERAATELAAATDSHETAMARLRAEHAAAAELAQSTQAEALAARDNAHAAALALAAADATEAQSTAFAELRTELEAAREAALAEAATASAAALAAAQSEHEAALATATAAHEAALSQINDKHGRELAVLGRKLTETEGSLTATKQSLEESVETGLELRQNLEARGKVLEEATAELAATRATRDELDATAQAHVRRIAELDEAKADLEARLARAQAKLDGDALLLERVRKAMAIGAALLDEQQKNSVDAE